MLDLLIGFSIGCIALMLLAIGRDHGRTRVGQIFITLLMATAIFLIDPRLPPGFDGFVTIVISAIPALFWLFCHHAFGETPRLSRSLLLLGAYTVISPAIMLVIPPSPLFKVVFHTLPSYGEYVLIGTGLWTVVENWSADLVSSRRRLRGVVIILTGSTILANVISVNFDYGSTLLQRELVALCLLVVAMQILSIPQGLLFGVDQKKYVRPGADNDSQSEDVDPKITAQLSELHQLMEQGFYRTEKPTIAALSKAVSIPEYLLRALINEHLGFRNFNDFINDWRIREAKQQLLSDADKPIMNIALDLGYRTLSSFNRAFKEREAMTPTQYRQGQLTS